MTEPKRRGRPPKAIVEGAVFQPEPKTVREDGPTFNQLIAKFKADYPEKWEAIRLGPTQHGIEQISEILDK